MADFEHNALTLRWSHPETDVVINDEDMPDELLPAPIAEWRWDDRG